VPKNVTVRSFPLRYELMRIPNPESLVHFWSTTGQDRVASRPSGYREV
jgi:hypothetical protein